MHAACCVDPGLDLGPRTSADAQSQCLCVCVSVCERVLLKAA